MAYQGPTLPDDAIYLISTYGDLWQRSKVSAWQRETMVVVPW